MLDELLNGANQAAVDLDGYKVAWPLALPGGNGYRADWIDKQQLDLDIQPVIPSKEIDDRDRRGVVFDREVYRARDIVKRLFGWLKECHRILCPLEKRAINFRDMIKLAFISRYLRLICAYLRRSPGRVPFELLNQDFDVQRIQKE